MKIAIKANPSRGKEIISLLKSLGSNTTNLSGDGKIHYYYMDKNHLIRYGDPPIDYKVYTLEEFEKEFPFKIGDEVIIIGLPDFPKVITQMTWDCGEILYSFEGLNNTWFGAKSLRKFKMKEERNITLTLYKAKEWYNKGGELREIALQAFTENELNPLPKSWEEFYEQYRFKDILDACLDAIRTNFVVRYENKFKAFVKLQYLRDCWRQGWEPKAHESIYAIKFSSRGLGVYNFVSREFLSFPTKEMAEEFLKCFIDLIEQAGDLI